MYMTYIWNLKGIFLHSLYIVITCEISAAVGCVLGYICKHVVSVWPFSLISVCLIFTMSKPHCSLTYVKYMYNDRRVETDVRHN